MASVRPDSIPSTKPRAALGALQNMAVYDDLMSVFSPFPPSSQSPMSPTCQLPSFAPCPTLPPSVGLWAGQNVPCSVTQPGLCFPKNPCSNTCFSPTPTPFLRSAWCVVVRLKEYLDPFKKFPSSLYRSRGLGPPTWTMALTP